MLPPVPPHIAAPHRRPAAAHPRQKIITTTAHATTTAANEAPILSTLFIVMPRILPEGVGQIRSKGPRLHPQDADCFPGLFGVGKPRDPQDATAEPSLRNDRHGPFNPFTD